ncbi:MAG: hypothetical protein R3F55_08725 [Alphaproteobacteria bacterium]
MRDPRHRRLHSGAGHGYRRDRDGAGPRRDRARGRVAARPGRHPLDEIGATGYGLAVAAEAASLFAGVDLAGARVAVEGYGAVGRHAARFLAGKGCVLVAAADSRGMVADPAGPRPRRAGRGQGPGAAASSTSMRRRKASRPTWSAPTATSGSRRRGRTCCARTMSAC